MFVQVHRSALPDEECAKKCKSCHGADGSGNTKMGKKLKCRDLSDPAVQKKLTDAQIAKSITAGVSEGGKWRNSFGIWAFGLLCDTIFLRMSVPILQGTLTQANEDRAC